MDTVLTLADIHLRDRLAFWYDVACEVFVDHECRVQTPSRFDVTMHHAPLGDLGIVKLDSTGLNSAAVTSRTITNGGATITAAIGGNPKRSSKSLPVLPNDLGAAA